MPKREYTVTFKSNENNQTVIQVIRDGKNLYGIDNKAMYLSYDVKQGDEVYVSLLSKTDRINLFQVMEGDNTIYFHSDTLKQNQWKRFNFVLP